MKNEDTKDKKEQNGEEKLELADEVSEKVKKQFEKLVEQKEKLANERAEFENKYKRALADYHNLEKRSFQERKEWIKTANKHLLLQLLPGLDTLMLANKHVTDQGLTLSIDQFLRILEQEGVKRIETEGKVFDPHTMECVEVIHGQEDGKVIEELRAGYTLYGEVLRPAGVKVGKKE